MERISSARVRVSYLTWGSLTSLLIAVAMFVGALDGLSESRRAGSSPAIPVCRRPRSSLRGFRSVLARWNARCLAGFKRQRDVMGCRDRSSQRYETRAAPTGSSHWPFHRTDASLPRGQ